MRKSHLSKKAIDKMIDVCNEVGEIICKAYPELEGAVVEVSEIAEDYFKCIELANSVEAFAEHYSKAAVDMFWNEAVPGYSENISFEPDNSLSIFTALNKGLLAFDGVALENRSGKPTERAIKNEIRGLLADALSRARLKIGYKVTREPFDINTLA